MEENYWQTLYASSVFSYTENCSLVWRLNSNMASSAASGLLGRQLKQMQSDKDIPGISCGLVGNNIFEWEVMLMISDDCKFYGGTATK